MVRFIDDPRRGESGKGRNATADFGSVGVRLASGADEGPANGRAAPTQDQTMYFDISDEQEEQRIVEQLEEEI